MRPELIVAEKEFRDHLTSKRFIAILVIFMLLAMYAMVTGMSTYNQSLDSYKQQQASNAQYKQQTITSYTQMIQDAQKRGASADEIQGLQDQMDSAVNPPAPSILQVFSSFTLLFAVMGMLLGGAMGFDQISKEKEDGSLKTVLSSPVYRDALINGKAIGALATLAIAMAAAFLLTIAIMLLYQVVPNIDDAIRIISFFIVSVIYCAVFFGIAMVMSTLAKNSAMAVIYTLGLVFLLVLFSIMSYMVSDPIAGLIVGPAPPQPNYYKTMPYMPVSYTTYADTNATAVDNRNATDSSGVVPIQVPTISPEEQAIEETYSNYTTKRYQTSAQIADVLNTASPISDFSGLMGFGNSGVAGALLSNTRPYTPTQTYWYYSSKEISVWASLSYVWIKLLALIVEIILAFGISYALFMRMDIR